MVDTIPYIYIRRHIRTYRRGVLATEAWALFEQFDTIPFPSSRIIATKRR